MIRQGTRGLAMTSLRETVFLFVSSLPVGSTTIFKPASDCFANTQAREHASTTLSHIYVYAQFLHVAATKDGSLPSSFETLLASSPGSK